MEENNNSNQPIEQPVQSVEQPVEQNNNQPGKGLAIASLILGICSLALSWIVWLGIILGVIAIILAIVSKSKAKYGMATAGIITGIIGLILSIACCLLCAVCVSAVGNSAKEVGDELDKVIEETDWNEVIESS